MKNAISNKQDFKSSFLSSRGLNIHAVIALSDIPENIIEKLQKADIKITKYSQLILIGHQGRNLWQNVGYCGIDSNDPIDEYTVKTVQEWFNKYYSTADYDVIYPGDYVVGLQQLGQLAGWHYDSPFRVGINDVWGSWFAYRAVVLADTNFEITDALEVDSPCISCNEKYCVAACPAHALENSELNFQCCIDYRKQAGSLCRSSCLARVSCPIGAENRYTDEQIQYHYGVSMKTIEEFY